MEQYLPVLGIVGNCLLLAAYIPQIVRLIKTKKAEDISLGMWFLWLAGDITFLAYSLIEKDLYSTILFGVFTLENIVLLALTLRYKKA